MPAVSSSAPGKIILFGEHAVVYGQPAIAVPVHQLKAKAYLFADPAAPRGQVTIDAPDIQLQSNLSDLPADHPFVSLFQLVQQHLHLPAFPAVRVRIKSDIPLAAGLGSGAAVSVALIRGLAEFTGSRLPDEEVCALAFEAEKIYHGTPSGIDNTVVTYASPVYFVKNKDPEIISISQPLTFLIADSGIRSKTRDAVTAVRERWENDKSHYESLFQRIGELSASAKEFLTAGSTQKIGELMSANHELLVQLSVSTHQLDGLVSAARSAGAYGAKLSGAGRGGNVIALVSGETSDFVRQAFLRAGAVTTYETTILPENKDPV